ncbi:hypothetical protein GCM10022198_18180 [Klugiella xanthotipulae]|uniref:Uncharacterized protein n=2 Tax=Klugiella xanthotipulae TaxID=244735 RepID=A0A543HRQ3_9MICO|nr:hypothetical protein FB466_1948 [Klugiella xanthotipulae]
MSDALAPVLDQARNRIAPLTALSRRIAADALPVEATAWGEDDTGCARVELSSTGTVLSVLITSTWDRSVHWSSLGDAVLQAHSRATHVLWAVREERIEENAAAGRDELVAESAEAHVIIPAAPASSEALSASRWEMYRAAREAMSAYRSGLLRAGAERRTIIDPGEIVTATAVGGSLASLEYEEYRVKFADVQQIGAATCRVMNRVAAHAEEAVAWTRSEVPAIASWLEMQRETETDESERYNG